MGNLAVESSQSGPSQAATERPPLAGKPPAATRPARATKAKLKVVDSDDESDEEASEASFR